MSDCVPHAAASAEFIQLHAQASTPTGDTHLCALPKEFRLDQQPFIQTQLEHAQFKSKYVSQQPFIERQLELSSTGAGRVAMVIPAGAGAASAVGTRPVVTMGQLLALLGHRAVLRTMYTASAVTRLLSWFLCHCLHTDSALLSHCCLGRYLVCLSCRDHWGQYVLAR